MTNPNSLIINKLLSIITEGEGKRGGEGLPNCYRWNFLGRRGPGSGGGVWSRRQFSGTTANAGWTVRFPCAAVKAGRTTWFSDPSMWSRSGGGVRRQHGGACGGHEGGRAVEVDAEEEGALVGVWRENDRVRV
jgi:hypothetical protein